MILTAKFWVSLLFKVLNFVRTCKFRHSTYLDESDFQEVRKEVSKLTANWQALGSALGLSRSATREIDLANRGDPSRCLDGVIEKWLNQDYNYEKFGLPTWKKLVAAVESNSGGKDPALAKKIGLARFTGKPLISLACIHRD